MHSEEKTEEFFRFLKNNKADLICHRDIVILIQKG